MNKRQTGSEYEQKAAQYLQAKGVHVLELNYRNICHVADYYRMTHGISEFTPIRYDVIAFCSDEVIWHQNAFEHVW